MDFYFSDTTSPPTTELSDSFSLSSTPIPSSVAQYKVDLVGYPGGRASPGHDLGYHTLLTRQSLPGTPTPTSTTHRILEPNLQIRASPSPWTELPTQLLDSSSCPSGSPRPLLSDTEKLLATFKGKKAPRCSPFDRLTDELVIKVFSFLSSNQLCTCARVCRRWYFLVWEPPLWTCLTLSSDKINVDRGLKTLFRLLCRDTPNVCFTVEKIILNGCVRLTDKGLFTIARKCPELRTFEVKGCTNVTNAGISEVVSRCLNLERLDVTGCYHITCIQPRQMLSGTLEASGSGTGADSASESISSAGRHLYLQYLDMTDCQALEDNGIKIVVRNCPQLTHLFLRRCLHITDVAVKYVASYCIMLKELSISDCLQVTDFGMYELAKLGPNLRYLSVAKCDQISDAGIKQIARHCYKLRYLNVRGCEAVSDDSIECLARSCPRLRALDIGKCDVSDHGLKLLSEHCPNLKKLSLKSCDIITDKGIQTIAYYCRGLQQLNIQDCIVTVDGYRTVKKFCKRCIIEHTNPGFC